MKGFNFSVILLILNFLTVYSQTESKDSIYSGRVCIIILINGFESDGIITFVKDDTVWFRNEYTEYSIPKDQIMEIKSPGSFSGKFISKEDVQDTTNECDVYLNKGSLLKDVRLLSCSDSNISIIKDKKQREVPVSLVRKITFIEPGFLKGFIIGAGIGFASGLLLGLTWPENSEMGNPNFGESMMLGMIFSIPTGLIGGIIGAITKTDQVYLLSTGYSSMKVKRINYIIEKHK